MSSARPNLGSEWGRNLRWKTWRHCFVHQLALDLGNGSLMGETGILVAAGGVGVANVDVACHRGR